jgi:FkbM family methyltransferase
VLRRPVRPRRPFRCEHVPLLGRIYRFPFERWPASRGKQILFGAPHLACFAIGRKLWPGPALGAFVLERDGAHRRVTYDARNSQFQALYRRDFAAGYEPELTALLDVILDPAGVFYDVGSNWGYFSLFVASQPGFAGRVHAFEPFPPSYRDLVSVVMQAGLQTTITCHALALADRPGQVTMRLPDGVHSGLATVELTASPGAGRGEIRAATLDQVTAANSPPSVIKIDAEGCEAAILAGGHRTLSEQRPLIVFESVRDFADPGRTLRPLRLLRELGYVFFHPCWSRCWEETPVLWPAEGPDACRDQEILALVPIGLEDRFLAYDQLNLFACPANYLPRLEAEFQR